ncbi:hypothetical protein OG884_00750 [Streptosporangium sp. NBC_01755]|uniref:phosphatase domain-containing protein n=1 Tax=unclassified Streptosporangium TaxID=2632669 RepID=UPI002DDA434D|nr:MULTISPECIES: hypothetical protein [unclassified Streptosporangium]WSA28024.1 hypothetical protein OIE13_09220 [Streptosporangium sp. NBC_01810]WSD00505.1 hypothetical protein OG884_00750 [Streptosporangium sp. NBC_01755]
MLADEGIDSALESEEISEQIRRGTGPRALEGASHGRKLYGYDRVHAGHPIAYVSGRKEQCRRQTEMWLAANVGHLDDAEGLWMRDDHDNQPDVQVKHDIYTEHFAHREIAGVIDDRAAVVRMWREELGLTVFQVAAGDY